MLAQLLPSPQKALAQQLTVSVKADNLTIESVLNDLRDRYGLSFVTRTEGLDLSARVTTDIRDAGLEQALTMIFHPQRIDVSVSGKIVSIASTRQTSFVVRGTVSDQDGEALPGATLMIKGTTRGAITDIGGNFAIELESPGTLVISSIGYVNQEIPVLPDMGFVRITMVPSSEFLEEVVVVGYGTLRRSLVSSAISKMTMDESKMLNVNNPASLLSGRIAGVRVSEGSGNLGAGERTVIRGISSLNAGNEPLYVIDGIPITNTNSNLFNFGEDMSSLSTLSINDIESIEVLKDAASAAIYGSRASNGVILITTKSGSEGRSAARVNVSAGVAMFPYPDKIRMADSKLYLEVYNEGVDNYNRQYGYKVGDANFREYRYNPFGNLPDINWMNTILQIGKQYGADASFSGGNRSTSYYLGGSYSHKEGTIKTNSMDKISFRTKVSHEFNRWLEVGSNMSANHMKTHQVPGASLGTTILPRALLQRPHDRVYKPDGNYFVGGTDELTYHNPVQILKEEVAFIEDMRFLGNFYIALKALNGKLVFKNTLNTDISQAYDYTFYNANHPYGLGVGRIIDRHRTIKNLGTDSVLNYGDSFLGGDLSVDAMLGHSFQQVDTRTINLDGNGFPSMSFDVVGVASTIAGYGGNAYTYALESYFGRVNLGYKDRHMLTATLRTDGSSKFQPDRRWGWFPSLSYGWNISKEEWMQGKGVDLKFRSSWGKTGNQEGIGVFASQSQMAGGKNYMNNSGIYSTVFGNANLTWEKAEQIDLGFDLGLFNDRLTVIFDWYLKNTTDLLYAKTTHATSGTTSITSNVGSIRNKGIELTVGGNLDLGEVHWSTSLNIAHNKNVVTSLTGDDDEIAIGSNRILKVGEEVGTFYLFQFDGVYQYDAEVPKVLYDQGVRAGDFRYANLDGDMEGHINDTDRAIRYSPNPKFSGGWNNTFYWKGLSLDAFFTYSYGNKVYFGLGNGIVKMGGNTGVWHEMAANRWTGPGSTNTYARAIAGSSWNAKNTDYFLYDGSFIRLKSLTLSYNFGKKVLDAFSMKGLRIYLQGDNLFLITRYPGYDPEVSSNLDARYFGVDNLNVPPPRTITFGANLTF